MSTVSRYRGTIPSSVAASIDADTRRALVRAGYVPALAGADGDPPPPADPPADPPPADPPADDWTPPTREEFEKLQKAAAEGSKAARKAKADAEAAAKRNAEEGGKFEDLYKTEAEKRAGLEAKLAGKAVNGAVAEVAQRLKFKNPNVAHKLISLDGITADLEAEDLDAAVDAAAKSTIEQRLTELAKAEPYLVGEQPPRTFQPAGPTNTETAADASGHASMNERIRRAAGRG